MLSFLFNIPLWGWQVEWWTPGPRGGGRGGCSMRSAFQFYEMEESQRRALVMIAHVMNVCNTTNRPLTNGEDGTLSVMGLLPHF